MRRTTTPGLILAALAFAAAADEPRPGAYGMQGWGLLTIVEADDGSRRFTLDTTGANAHVCHLDGRLEGERALPEGERAGVCEVSMAASGDRIDVSATGEGCRYYCGMRAWFEGTYLRMPADCLPAARERRNAAFLAEYRARRYADALARLEDTARECGGFLGWVEQDAFANDQAITLYHLGRHAQCLDVLKATRAAAAHDEASLDEEMRLPPADRETYLPVARATWHNRALCERAAARDGWNRGR